MLNAISPRSNDSDGEVLTKEDLRKLTAQAHLMSTSRSMVEREKDFRLNPAAKKKKLPSVTQKVFNLDKPQIKDGAIAFEPYEMETVIEVPAYLENRPSTSPKPPLLFSQQKAMKTDLHNDEEA